MLDMNNSFGIEPCISRRTSCKNDISVRSSVYAFKETGDVGVAANQRAGAGNGADLFARAPFKATGWAGYEKHRQHQQRSREKREKEGSPKTHPPMGATKGGKQARDKVTENGWCHDLTATN
jgi:hypothetical protein